MAKKFTMDLVALANLLIAIFLFFFIIGITNLLTQLAGIIGCLVRIIVESYYLYKTKIEWWISRLLGRW